MEFITNIQSLIAENGILFFKIPLLILLFVYLIFLFIIIQRINALNRTITIIAAYASRILQIVAVVQFFLALSLFLLAIVIV